jgi:hypothetical protein
MPNYMLIMRSDSAEVNERFMSIPFEDALAAFGRFNEALVEAGVLVAAEGLDDPANTVVVDYAQTPPVVTDGPYGETKELFNGFWVLSVDTVEQAVEWAKKIPLSGPGQKTEIRRIPTIDEFPQDNEYIQREIEWRKELLRRQLAKQEA